MLHWAHQNHITLLAKYVPRARNVRADRLSRHNQNAPSRMVPASTNLQANLENMGHPMDRFLYDQVEQSTSGLHISNSRSSIPFHRRSSTAMGSDYSLCLPSHRVDKEDSKQSSTIRTPTADPDCTKLASTRVVCRPTSQENSQTGRNC